MTFWAVAAAAYGLLLACAAATQPICRRRLAFAASVTYAAGALALGRLSPGLWLNLVAPGALLLLGYWLSGFFFRDPQPWLEAVLLRADRLFRADRWMSHMPRPLAEVLELGYLADYVVVGGGAVYTATFGTEALIHYWNLVLPAELASFAPLPWLRSRPPRAIEGTRDTAHVAGRAARDRSLIFRRLNTAILDRASVQANTLPSGHVAGAVAAALGVMAVDAGAGMWLMGTAGVITIAAIAGRYHYVIDCVAGVVVALAVSSVM